MENFMEQLAGWYKDHRLLYALITVVTLGISGTLFALLMKLVTRDTVLDENEEDKPGEVH